MKFRLLMLAGIAAAAVSAQTAHAAPLAVALSGDGTSLVLFGVTTPGSVTNVTINGAGSRLDALDFRPADGRLYGYDDVSDRYFTVDPYTGVLTSATIAGGVMSPTDTGRLDIDFNPTIDRLRTVTESNQNIVYNPQTQNASSTGVSPLAYGAGDPNAGADPSVTANAYTNSFAGATMTTQYVLDHQLNIVATLANNAGTLTTVGGTGVDFNANAGFDIFFEGANTGYALLDDGAGADLYTINLATGAATRIGAIGDGLSAFKGLAVGNVPEPGSMALLLLGAAGFAAVRRRRLQER